MPIEKSINTILLNYLSECEAHHATKNIMEEIGNRLYRDLMSNKKEILMSPIRFSGVHENMIKHIMEEHGFNNLTVF